MRLACSSRYIYLVLLLSLIIRLVAWNNTYVVNQDGTLYINQAKAIYYGQKEALFCGYNFVANYPVLIAGAYSLFQDWLFAARFVSLLFGYATLIPLYLLLRRSFDPEISALCTLLFGMLPVFVGSSVDLIRDPTCWFFLMLGLHLFVKGVEDGSSSGMFFSNLSFLMATWARIEASLLIIISFVYLFLSNQKNRTKNIVYFLMPVILLTTTALLYLYVTQDGSIRNQLRIDQIIDKMISPHAKYNELLASLAGEAFLHRNQMLEFFLSEARTNVWLIALGTLLNRYAETLLYIYAIISLVGAFRISKYMRNSSVIKYQVALLISFVILIYIHIIHSWFLEYRHVCIMILVSCSIIAYGLKEVFLYIETKITSKKHLAFISLVLLIILPTIPKNVIPRDMDKLVFKEIGQSIANHELGTDMIRVSSPISIQQWISFYANLSYQGVFCPAPSGENCWEFNVTEYDFFVAHLKQQHINYFVWTQKHWPADKIDLSRAQLQLHLKELGRWYHPDTGEIILFEVT